MRVNDILPLTRIFTIGRRLRESYSHSALLTPPDAPRMMLEAGCFE